MSRFALRTAFAALLCGVATLRAESVLGGQPADVPQLQLATFTADITLPLGHMLYDKPLTTIEHPLLAKGLVLQDGTERYVLCALDWCVVRNSAHDLLRRKIAAAAQTEVGRVAVQSVHQHTAPPVDADAQKLLGSGDPASQNIDLSFLDAVGDRLAAAVKEALARLTPFDRVGSGEARVERVAAIRRVFDAQGKLHTRWSSCTDPALRALPEGNIDPLLRTITFARGDRPLVRLHYYATHPQSYYNDGRASYDVPGIAREKRQQEENVFQVYFTGCAGDVTMGKYNDGTPAARAELAERLLAGMRVAADATHFGPAEHIQWRTVPLRLTARRDGQYDPAKIQALLDNPKTKPRDRMWAASRLACGRRLAEPIELSALKIGPIRVVHLPGEPMVEFQHFATSCLPDQFVAVAGYGLASTGYICTEQAFAEGGYEPSASMVVPTSEWRLKTAIRKLLNVTYNAVELPSAWPPRMKDFPDDPQRPPYLATPPATIPIDVGRQLFVDDFLIAETTLRRTFHQPRYFAGNPVLKATQPWEGTSRGPYAMPFSDGVWYDPQDGRFKLWYYAGAVTCYAVSPDGLHWEKPALDVEPGTNIVLRAARDSGTVWIDPSPRDPGERYKMALYNRNFMLYRSPDGIHWTKVSDGAKTGDRSTFFYNPFRDAWVYSIRAGGRLGRSRQYWESDDFFRFSDAVLARDPAALWVASDSGDWRRDDLQSKPQLYNLDCAAYESVLLGLFSIWRGDYRSTPATPQAAELQQAGRPKQNSVCVGFSRDGFHWDRPDRRVFIPVSEKAGDWNWGNVQSTAPGCLVVGDELRFYVSGRAGKSQPGCTHCDSAASTGLATLRRDGFASLDAGETPGTLTTRPLRFRGRHMFVNLDAPDGELRVEVLDLAGQPIAPFDREHCQPVRGDKTLEPVRWTNAADLSAVSNRPVRLRFHLTRGRLYAFWVTPDPAGASYGHLAGGGPAYGGWIDVPKARQ